MNPTAPPSPRQDGPTVRSIRIGREDSILFFLSDLRKLQLSANQIAVLAAADELPFPTRELRRLVYGADGPATPSQRASLSRMRRRLEEFDLIAGGDRHVVDLTPLGAAVVEALRQRGSLTAKERDDSWKRLTGSQRPPSLLTSGGGEAA